MLTLHKDSSTIITEPGFSVKTKWVNPACFFDSIPGDVGLGLEIPANEFTRAEFGFPERFEKRSSGNDRKFPGMSLRFSGMTLMRGTLVITNATAEMYSGWLQSELGVLGTAQRDKFITELPWKSGVEFQNKATYLPGTDDYTCPMIQNPVFWDGMGRELPEGANYRDKLGNLKITTEQINALTIMFREFKNFTVNNTVLATGLIDIADPACVVSPCLFLNFALKEIFRMTGFEVTPERNALDDLFFNPVIYNNYNIFKQEFELEERTWSTWNPETNEDENVQVYQVVNLAWSLGLFSYADLVPRIALKDFILSIQNFLNVVFVFRPGQKVDIINRNLIPNAEAFSLDEYMIGLWKLGERKNVTLKFIQEQEKNDELFKDWHDLSDRRTDFREPVDTFAELRAIANPAFGELRLVREENKIYEYKWAVFAAEDEWRWEQQTDVCDWIFASYGPQPYFHGDADEVEEIKSGCSTLQGEILWQARQRGNISSARSLWSDFSLRLLPNGLTGSLKFEGEAALFDTRWRQWADFWKNRLPVEATFRLPANIIYYIINNITQPYSTRHGRFIIEEMECDFSGPNIGNVTIKGYKL